MNKIKRLSFWAIGGMLAGIAGYLSYKPEKPNANQSTALEPDQASGKLLFVLNAQSANPASHHFQTLQQLRNKYLLVNFWATWCPPCIKEMPELDQLQMALKSPKNPHAIASGDFETIGIAIDTETNVAQFLTKTPIRYPLFAVGAQGLELVKSMGNQQGVLPFSVLLEPQGRIVWQHIGVLNMAETEKQIRQMMRK